MTREIAADQLRFRYREVVRLSRVAEPTEDRPGEIASERIHENRSMNLAARHRAMPLRNWYGRSSGSGGLTISEAAATYGVTSRALRFYESRNLLSPKRIGNVRVYSASDEARLQLIIKGKKLGFSLAEIASFLPFWASRASANPVPALQIDIERIEQQLQALLQKRSVVVAAIEELRAQDAKLEGDKHRSTSRTQGRRKAAARSRTGLAKP